MTVLKPEAEIGHCVPPESNYAITTYVPGWDTAIAFREGDPAVLSKIVHIYPRFGPFRTVGELFRGIAGAIKIPEGHGLLAWTSSVAIPMFRAHCYSPHRKDPKLAPNELTFRVVDIGDIRLYAAVFPAPKTPGVIGGWQNPGIGPSIRLSEDLLAKIDTLTEVECDKKGRNPPARNAGLSEGASHDGLRRRIVDLLHRAPIDPDKIRVKPDDVFLYQTGMASIYAAHNLILAHRPGTVVMLGSLFHSTFHWLIEQSPHGVKHFGAVDAAGLDILEAWLGEERAAGRPVSYALIEFPSNPLLASADLRRLKALAEEHGFVFIVDDTIGSFANIDVLPQSDILATSLTKSFSGYANVMAGSLVLNPLSSHYAALKPLWDREFVNDLYIRDADVLLKNSNDYLDRTVVLNANAAQMASHLSSLTRTHDAASPILRARYPLEAPDRAIYESFLRRPTPELPAPGAGCLLNVDFTDVAAARAFYDALAVYPGPHLGAHRTLSLCYTALVFGKDPIEAAEHRTYGVIEESVRISAGLETAADLVDTLDVAVKAAFEASAAREKQEGLANGVGAAEAAVGSGLAA
ncbi:cystathionine gamma-synthase [Plectosphaerella plurivora]|uniref:Cystathionine gamma-synthase n=1 Tax=Plectosphaerella plurivora TaxID=936078 RepID=A0A9P8VGM1_9PEZI|nr:cystathionine gamma-synthase [Plectosphaerella plurivora]